MDLVKGERIVDLVYLNWEMFLVVWLNDGWLGLLSVLNKALWWKPWITSLYCQRACEMECWGMSRFLAKEKGL